MIFSWHKVKELIIKQTRKKKEKRGKMQRFARTKIGLQELKGTSFEQAIF